MQMPFSNLVKGKYELVRHTQHELWCNTVYTKRAEKDVIHQHRSWHLELKKSDALQHRHANSLQ